jgi:UDP-N-acetylmuramoyl-tripeptide--D-alanyl-D-alanine ligase
MKAAIDVLCKAEGRKTAVLGDMFELGDFGPKLHFEVGEYAAEKGIDEIICIGSISKNIYDGVLSKNGHAVYFEDTESFFKNGFELLNIADSTVLVKASHSMQFEKIAERIAEVN